MNNSDSVKYKLLLDQKIPMRDGVKLSANIYLPHHPSPCPALFLLTPYNVDRNHKQAVFFVKNGFAVVLADTRGRGNSEGKFNPFSQQDGFDGFDLCNWISQQNWCNGKTGMFGGSYLGMVQWLTLKNQPIALKTIVPTASVCPGIDFPKKNNIFYTYLAPYFCFILGKTTNLNLFSDNEFWYSYYLDYQKGNFKYSDLFDHLQINFPKFKTWLRHPSFDSYWKKILPDKDDFVKINIPILSITGYFDDDQFGALYYFKNHLKYNFEFASKKHFLIIGPWDHAGTREPSDFIENQKFSSKSQLNLNKIHLDWFNWTLNEYDKPSYLESNFNFYLINKNKWYFFDLSSPNIIQKTTKLFLTQKNKLSFSECKKNIQYNLTIDPLDFNEYSYDLKQNSSYNYAFHLFDFNNKPTELLFESQILKDSVHIGGNFVLDLFIKTDLPDFDLEFILYEKNKSGEYFFLTKDYLRFRYANSLEKPSINTSKNKITKISLSNSNLIYKLINKGNKIVLHIKHLNMSVFQKNYNSGKDISFEKPEDALKRNLIIFCNSKYPSCLNIPLLKDFKENETI